MPYFGLLPFLPTGRGVTAEEWEVSMPYFGLLPFLQLVELRKEAQERRVNALLRASPISTLSPGNAHK